MLTTIIYLDDDNTKREVHIDLKTIIRIEYTPQEILLTDNLGKLFEISLCPPDRAFKKGVSGEKETEICLEHFRACAKRIANATKFNKPISYDFVVDLTTTEKGK